MIISHARVDDLAGIVELEKVGFDAEEQWSETAWADELAAHDRYVLARLDADSRVIGVATFSCVAELADLNRVIVHPEFRGRGIGASLLRAGLEWANAVGAHRMLLEVRPDNEPAVALYRGLGFEPIATRRDYYGTGQHALVMARSLRVGDAWAVECA
ncbi:MAG TPA: ribosomal protein S18-alanine N-acetyltransferase [Propionicimonas sp.]|jgi:ribosomal-protein-alanine N-acetyltransferase|uniref:ribosomal protein S18-alanine N-acetyltransferase n=1 Tax=Propionicimonas sp. TaxID=1955623 RepID=UPI002F3F639E